MLGKWVTNYDVTQRKLRSSVPVGDDDGDLWHPFLLPLIKCFCVYQFKIED